MGYRHIVWRLNTPLSLRPEFPTTRERDTAAQCSGQLKTLQPWLMGSVNEAFLMYFSSYISGPVYWKLPEMVTRACDWPSENTHGRKNKTENKGGREERKERDKKNQWTYTHVWVCAGIEKGLGETIWRISSEKTFREVVRNLHYY